jgi:ATP-dependent DNA helicase RecG
VDALSSLQGVTPKTLEMLGKLKITEILDLLFHLPLRYIDRSKIIKIADIHTNAEVQVVGYVSNAKVIYGRRRMMVAQLQDDTATLKLRFFHFNQKQLQALADGKRVLCFGEARRHGHDIEMVHPQYRILNEGERIVLSKTLEPVYPTTKGLTQPRLHKLIQNALKWASKQPQLFEQVLTGFENKAFIEQPVLSLLKQVHCPDASEDTSSLVEKKHPAQRQLKFEELLAHHLSLMQVRIRDNQRKAHAFSIGGELVNQFMQALPYQLTDAQQRVLKDIEKDLSSSRPMLRLVQGDVGSGKTVVALISCLHAVQLGLQAAFMAPTELLAEQHYRYFSQQLIPLGLQVAWLSSSLTRKQRAAMIEMLRTGTAAVVVGTHAVFQDDVKFKNLALCITDEQHRFGVHQRLQLSQKGVDDQYFPHQLIMTATPIPRTLAMSLYAHLDYSAIDEMPPGRKPITTVAIANSRREQVMDRVKQACLQGAQAYWVCSLIDESEHLECQAASDTYDLLKQHLPEISFGLVHGRLKSAEKDAVMQSFIHKKIDVLVATTVIEVGVDVPNATLIVIENAERFGLAQLHQLRGRVGRGEKQSSCVLLYKAPLGDYAKRRIDALRNSNDGFELAQVDLELRGPGEVLGTKQSGDMQLRIASLSSDMHLLPEVRRAAQWLIDNHPERVNILMRRWLGQAVQYARA